MTTVEPAQMGVDILLVGCGNMGCALLSGYLAHVPDGTVLVVDHNPARVEASLPRNPGVRIVAALREAGSVRPAMTVLAVKPQAMAATLPLLAGVPAAEGLVVSVAAGFGAAALAVSLPHARIVRAMPNTPALVGVGMTGLWCGPALDELDRRRCEALFGSVGLVRWVTDEADMDAVTAISGSGPAYAFAFVEALAEAGCKAGLAPSLADELARATLTGAAALLAGPNFGPAALKAAVRSPHGTTDAALQVFERGDALVRLVGDAVAAAHLRAMQLGLDLQEIST